MSDWDDADDLATAVAILGAAGVLLTMTSSIGDASTAQMIAWAADVIRTIVVPSFGLIILFWFLLKAEPLIDAFADW
ncbi:hypothetical protein [Halomicrobium sp. LC1Hm]|uniref:hypothetical protein n=1 Tax=Halomicrobium sp. LC1Hm TaxID=2610902 RepID=UPI00129841ED|nr:hypothetical protein [Halomicrobium sp. LC1Hm]QGA81595.1 hypothetical protein LC1Hm_0531 [Halomicrobium sp. LC1Hm]